MKNYNIILFVIIVFTIYTLTNIYIYIKGYNAVPLFRNNRILYSLAFIILAGTFIAGKILEASHSSVFSDVLNIAGGFWMAFMLYGFLFLLLSDIFSVVLKISINLSGDELASYRKWSYIAILVTTILLIIAGFVNALIPQVKRYDITINKSAGNTDRLRIAAVSDIHLGSIIRKRSIRKLSLILKELKPDLVLLLGDIVDGEIGPVIRDDLLQYFKCPKCKYGLLAITGNHEFIGGAGRTIPYIESKGIRVLKDEVVSIDGCIQIAGRLDRDSRRFSGEERLQLKELFRDIDPASPIILLDHQPFKLKESEEYGVDLHLSGHTHKGQIWPLNYITNKVFELSYGYKKKGETHYIVSSGFGLWGPRVRLGSRSEVLIINIEFRHSGSPQQ